MGAAGSALDVSLKDKVVQVEGLNPILKNILLSNRKQSLPQQLTLHEIFELCKDKTDVFLTHNWGANKENHKRVAEINSKLKEKGLLTWFDDEKMEGNVKRKMTEGIDNASVVIVFLTDVYIDKVNGDNPEDNCQLEFGYAAQRKTSAKMIPVVMEASCRNTASWGGELGMVIGRLLYVDMCDGVRDAKIDELCGRILSLIGMKLQDLLQDTITTYSANHIGTISNEDHDRVIRAELKCWLMTEVHLVSANADAAADCLVKAGVASVERLSKKVTRDPGFVRSLGIDEDDADDIVKAVGSRSIGNSRISPSSAQEKANFVNDKTIKGGKEVREFKYPDGAVYIGEWRDEKREGHGVMKYANGAVYDGEWKNDKKEGHGVLKFADGAVYDGELKNDKMEGHGVYTYPSGAVYDGELKNDKMEGHGVMKYANGAVYDGEWKNDKKEGHGVMKFADGGVYAGVWKNDKMEGHGVYTYPSGTVYDGELKNDNKEGHGVLKFADGAVYDGEWRNDKKEGRGVYTYPSGAVYDGEWKNDNKEGHGVFTYPSGAVYDGEWKNDKMEGH